MDKNLDEEVKTKIDKLTKNCNDANLRLKKNKSESLNSGLTGFGFLGISVLTLLLAIFIPTGLPFALSLFGCIALTTSSIITLVPGAQNLTRFFKNLKQAKALKKSIREYTTEIEQIKLDGELNSDQQTNHNKITKNTYKNIASEVENNSNNTL